MALSEPLFYFDVSSPYAYLAASRVDDVLPIEPSWLPIAFGVIINKVGKVPWSLKDGRQADFDEIARRAAERGLPEVRYPDGWPADTYSLAPLRALVLAADEGQELVRALARDLYRTMFVEGQHLADVEAVLDAAKRAGMDRAAVREGMGRDDVKDRLRAATDDALARGVTGVPTIAVGDQLFWGDDRLEDAAAATAQAR